MNQVAKTALWSVHRCEEEVCAKGANLAWVSFYPFLVTFFIFFKYVEGFCAVLTSISLLQPLRGESQTAVFNLRKARKEAISLLGERTQRAGFFMEGMEPLCTMAGTLISCLERA